MMSYQPGELVLIAFPFAGGTGSKVRPGLVIADTGDDDVVVARLTSQPPVTSFDVPVTAWQAAGLKGPSVVRTHKLATVEKALVRRQLGQLDAADRPSVAAAIRQLTAAW